LKTKSENPRNDKALSVCTCSCPDVGLWYGARYVINYNIITGTYNMRTDIKKVCIVGSWTLFMRWGGQWKTWTFSKTEKWMFLECIAILILYFILIPKCPWHSGFSCIFQMNCFHFLQNDWKNLSKVEWQCALKKFNIVLRWSLCCFWLRHAQQRNMSYVRNIQ